MVISSIQQHQFDNNFYFVLSSIQTDFRRTSILFIVKENVLAELADLLQSCRAFEKWTTSLATVFWSIDYTNNIIDTLTSNSGRVRKANRKTLLH